MRFTVLLAGLAAFTATTVVAAPHAEAAPAPTPVRQVPADIVDIAARVAKRTDLPEEVAAFARSVAARVDLASASGSGHHPHPSGSGKPHWPHPSAEPSGGWEEW